MREIVSPIFFLLVAWLDIPRANNVQVLNRVARPIYAIAVFDLHKTLLPSIENDNVMKIPYGRGRSLVRGLLDKVKPRY